MIQLILKRQKLSQEKLEAVFRMFFKIGVLKNFANFTGRHLVLELLFKKVAGPKALRPGTLLKRDSNTQGLFQKIEHECGITRKVQENSVKGHICGFLNLNDDFHSLKRHVFLEFFKENRAIHFSKKGTACEYTDTGVSL